MFISLLYYIGATERDNTVATAFGVAIPMFFLVVLVIFSGNLICCLKRRHYVIQKVTTQTGD